MIRYGHFQDFTHRIARRSLKKYCKYIYDAASEPGKPQINPLQRRDWHEASPMCRLYLPKPLVSSRGASYTLAGDPTCTVSHAGQHHPLTHCSGKHHFPWHTSRGSTGTYTLLCCPHMPALRNVKRAQTQTPSSVRPLHHPGFGLFTHGVPYGEQAAVWKQLCESKKHDWLLSNLIQAGLLTPQVLQRLSSETHSRPTQSRSFMQRSRLGYGPAVGHPPAHRARGLGGGCCFLRHWGFLTPGMQQGKERRGEKKNPNKKPP